MSHFDRQLAAALADRAARMTNAGLAALLADPEVSPIGRRVLEAEVAARTVHEQHSGHDRSRPAETGNPRRRTAPGALPGAVLGEAMGRPLDGGIESRGLRISAGPTAGRRVRTGLNS